MTGREVYALVGLCLIISISTFVQSGMDTHCTGKVILGFGGQK